MVTGMELQDIDRLLIFFVAVFFVFKGLLFLLSWLVSRRLTPPEFRTALGDAYRGVFASLAGVSFLLAALSFQRYIEGVGEQTTTHLSIQVGLRMALLAAMAAAFVFDYRALRELVRRYRNPRIDISTEGVLGTLAGAMPIIVADDTSTVRFSTRRLEELFRAADGELEGLPIRELMPVKYRDHHDAGMRRYIETGEGKLINSVVNVDILRRDGTELPIHLALTAATVKGRHWFIGAIWERSGSEENTHAHL